MKVGLVVNRTKLEASRFVPGLVKWLKFKGHESFVVKERASAGSPTGQADLVIALGGDGTLLHAARVVGKSETPIMGVNLGGLGFLTEFSTREARAGILAFAKGKHTEERRMVLFCRYGTKNGHALNDCAINMGPNGRVIEVICRSSGTFVNRFVGDGIVVATPTGSTAYSLAAGGPVVYPTMEAILLTPLAPHALAARPLILASDAEVELELTPDSGPAVLNLDGQRRWRITSGRAVTITRAGFCVRLVTPRKRTYYSILRGKLKWSGSQV